MDITVSDLIDLVDSARTIVSYNQQLAKICIVRSEDMGSSEQNQINTVKEIFDSHAVEFDYNGDLVNPDQAGIIITITVDGSRCDNDDCHNCMIQTYKETLDSFLDSEAFMNGVISSTKASWDGSGYSVELFPDKTWRVLDDNHIGNLYRSPGIIISLPALNVDDMYEYVDSGAGDEDQYMREEFYIQEDDIKDNLRNQIY